MGAGSGGGRGGTELPLVENTGTDADGGLPRLCPLTLVTAVSYIHSSKTFPTVILP